MRAAFLVIALVMGCAPARPARVRSVAHFRDKPIPGPRCACQKKPALTVEEASQTFIVKEVQLAAMYVEVLEERWGTPLEKTLPAPHVLSSDAAGFERALSSQRQKARLAGEAAVGSLKKIVSERFMAAREAYLASTHGEVSVPPAEARFKLMAVLDDATEQLAAAATAGAHAALAETPYDFDDSLKVDAEKLVSGTSLPASAVMALSTPRIRREVAPRIDELAKQIGEEIAAEERSRLAPLVNKH